jgi:hypothetical protein
MLKPFPWQKGNTNTGSFHYDSEAQKEVWFHGKGQTDNWCQCAGLKTDEPCAVVAVPTPSEAGGGARYLVFKSLGQCCKLGTFDKGFGPLRRDWLRGAKKTSQVKIGNRSCTTWAGGPPGDWFTMVSDDWSVDYLGRPCHYADHFKSWARVLLGIAHTLTFDGASYAETVEPDAIFALPEGIDCEQDCPNTAGKWCKPDSKESSLSIYV